MALSAIGAATVRRLRRFSLTTHSIERLARFYETAFGFQPLAAQRHAGPDFERLMAVNGGAQSLLLGLGGESVELLQFDSPGEPYPWGTSSSDLEFQHFAIVVTDIGQAYERLLTLPGWTGISSDGPQRLPASSGAVTAFKFRDPEGHPLELLAFPDSAVPPGWAAVSAREWCLGIDHSAICVADTARSVIFYEALGLTVSARSLNRGPGQERLDAVRAPTVEVTAMRPSQTPAHLELLCYRSVKYGPQAAAHSNDIAATRLVLEADAPTAAPDGSPPQHRLDPDGHHLLIVPPFD